MKYLLITFILTVISVTVFATNPFKKLDNLTSKDKLDTLASSQLYQDGRKATNYLALKADSLLTKSAHFVNKAGETIWESLVTQQRVKSIAILFSIMAYFSLLYFYGRSIKKFSLDKESKHDHYTNHQTAFIWIGLVILICLGAFNVSHFTTMLTGLINPRYGALLDLAKAGNIILNK